ncbi:hypothetical protein [Psychroserpens sp. NJDZ02]|uniref:hypothetical protein n=1 Tax=Psychroserpens sp. NJDZ02 TaxID=2570561 RepID=UPI0010A8C488|nr:hypothetical protein [Psychroserpens sp. NJDZ02]QCE40699.1 hypothetical protein E9099_04450 [Psychroserpens sp. NJDZ02]
MNNKKDLVIGFISGIICTCVGVFLYIIMFSKLGTKDIVSHALQFKFVSRGALLNLGLFFLFLNRKQDEKAKGVLIATLIIGLIFIINRL